MTQNIKNFIEEGEKEFEGFGKTKINGATFDYTNLYSKLKDWHSSRQISLIKMIVEMVESEKKIKTFPQSLNTWDGKTEHFERLSSSDINFNQALDTISSKLKDLVKE